MGKKNPFQKWPGPQAHKSITQLREPGPQAQKNIFSWQQRTPPQWAKFIDDTAQTNLFQGFCVWFVVVLGVSLLPFAGSWFVVVLEASLSSASRRLAP